MKQSLPALSLAWLVTIGNSYGAEGPAVQPQTPSPPPIPEERRHDPMITTRRRIVIDTAPDMTSRQRRRAGEFGHVHTIEL